MKFPNNDVFIENWINGVRIGNGKWYIQMVIIMKGIRIII
jgi:hypothetical protein